ncbi:Outer membrane protein assembly factor BamB precursor [Posidoniimonas polymericola]|uniref:Outer membrane protein assembly factor BamB n=1 Tax=Posidoniimonas polymericola TaxID=2528002 RepID=A0A5C5YH20_9BACT|nr:PQQ-binding-like beta-propeller repeat protein [Posidoniimonas polymericola]TWT73805.1 Outer membrane protein assembly factor BamB precursor [Posidoniimonas polymericola]
MSTRQTHYILGLFLIFGTAAQLAHGDDWPQWLGPHRDGVWRESGIIEQFPEGGPTVKWRTPIGGGYSGPAVVGNRVFVTDRQLAGGQRISPNAFDRSPTQGSERVLCLDAESGEILWTHEYPCEYSISYAAGPRTTPVVTGGKLYSVGAEGDLVCLDAETGEPLWSKQFKEDYDMPAPVWGFSGHPLVDGKRLICLVGGQGSVAVAFDKDSGEEIWRSLSAAEPGYCPPVILELGGKRQLIIWHPQAINGLDPETGEVYWSTPFDVRAGMTIPTPRQAGQRLFVTNFYDGPMMLEFKEGQAGPDLLWRGNSHSERNTDKLHSVMSTPVIQDGHIYGVDSYGQLRCLDLETGERSWEDLTASGSTGDLRDSSNRWANVFLIPHEDRFFLANEKGDLIIAKLTPTGYEELSRAHVIEADNPMPGRKVVWSHPALANRCAYLRNDSEIICVDLSKD